MSYMKRELERLADLVIYGTPETIEREFEKVSGLHDRGALGLIAYAIETARQMTPLCGCGADYFLELHKKHPRYVEQTNTNGANA